MRILAKREFRVGFGFENEGSGFLWGVFVGEGERRQGAGEVFERVLNYAFDGGHEWSARLAEETAEIGRRNRREGLGEFGEPLLVNGLAGGRREELLESLFFAGHGGTRLRRADGRPR